MIEIDRRIRPTLAAGVILLALASGGCRLQPEEPGAVPPVAPPAAPPAAAVEIRNARTPLPGVLTGGQPTEVQIEQAAAAGYRTVVNLRTAGEQGSWDEAPKVEALGMRYVSIPVAGADGLDLENVRRLFDVLEDPSHYPVMVHCGSGNRIGALFALEAFHVDGKDAETALAVGREAGLTGLEDAVRALLESAGGSTP